MLCWKRCCCCCYCCCDDEPIEASMNIRGEFKKPQVWTLPTSVKQTSCKNNETMATR